MVTNIFGTKELLKQLEMETFQEQKEMNQKQEEYGIQEDHMVDVVVTPQA